MKRWLLCVVVLSAAACGSSSPGGPDGRANDRDAGGSGSNADAPLAGGSDARTSPDAAADGSLPPPAAARRICAGYESTCTILATGDVKCWGLNNHGQLGLGDTNNRGDAPDEMGAVLPKVQLGTGRTAVSLACGTQHVCAVLDDASVKCWGHNGYAQLGLGDTADRGVHLNQMGDDLPPVNLGPGLAAVELAATDSSTCARFSDGRVKCWGSGGQGQLGDGAAAELGDQASEMGAALPFVDLGTGRTAKLLVGGYEDAMMCAILDNDQLKCWGANSYGQLGLGDTADRGATTGTMGDDLPFVDLATLAVDQVSTSGLQSCAIIAGGKVRCWGIGDNGALGDGLTGNRGGSSNQMGGNLGTVPLTGAARLVEVGYDMACAVTTTGLYCWGYNGFGELGLGSTTNIGDQAGEVAALAPVDLGTTQEIEQLAVGNEHVCARFADGSIRCWGGGASGDLGDGSVASVGDGSGEMGTALPTVAL